MSRSLHTNRDFEKLEPYEGKPSRTVLRGEEGSNALDLPDRPSDLQQRNGRAIRKGNEVAKLYANNNVDIVIYAVEKSLDGYKFNLLHNKQLFITQLKNGTMGTRTIDEGTMDEQSGMNFSEYMAILSGNTDLLDKAKLEKRIASLESERKAFHKNKSSSVWKLKEATCTMDHNKDIIARMTSDFAVFNTRLQIDKDGNKLNPLQLDGVNDTDIKVLGARLAQINEKARTGGETQKIGELYGFTVMVKTESSSQNLFELNQNKFMIMGEGGIKYTYNNGNIANDPKLATMNFLNALERIPKLIEQYQAANEKFERDVPILQQVVSSTWKKEDELKELKTEVAALERKIQLSLTPQKEEQPTEDNSQGTGQSQPIVQPTTDATSPQSNRPPINGEIIEQADIHSQNSHAFVVKVPHYESAERPKIRL
ncbi:MAG: DNA methylase [Brevinema sp.]